MCTFFFLGKSISFISIHVIKVIEIFNHSKYNSEKIIEFCKKITI